MSTINVEDCRNGLRERFQDQANWRRRKATEYPDDQRNLAAAEHLDQLAATVATVPDDLIIAMEELFIDLPDHEVFEENLRQIGFHTAYDDATEFVRDFIRDRTSG